MGCLFCDFVEKTKTTNVVYEDDHALAFRDINPQAPTHILVVPNKHLDGVLDVGEADAELAARCLLAINHVARSEGFGHTGYRVVINEGRDANQTVEHLHFHVLAGRHLGWPPG